MSRFVLIDGNAILHRAFHALPPLTNLKGDLSNAVYGFFSMFLKIVGDLKPEYLAVCFDRPKPTFRQALYVGYHAQRPKMDEGLVSQITVVHEILHRAKIEIFEVDGYEADDLIGTLAVQAVRGQRLEPSQRKKPKLQALVPNDLDVVIVSGDRDMLQLVNGRVEVLAPVIGITKMILFDAKKVEEKYGLNPSQIIDYKALVGDPSDNYPGISGVGPKTASELLKKYETFEKIYENLGELPPNLAQKFAKDAEQAALAKKLATIVTDAPITLNIDKCSMLHFDTKEITKAFVEQGFKSLVKRLEGSSNGDEKPTMEENRKKTKNDNGQLGLL
ncbi:MAG: 5'-3' exonuclease H3TH domain-containing protein [Candidatus Levybacteria bacterium]|nr:5'-3' exonuclease H3TH domain-containing protein [Candidatus Levybacteria bacterium]